MKKCFFISLSIILMNVLISCSSDDNEDTVLNDEMVVTGNAEPGASYVIITGYVNTNYVSANNSGTKIGAEVSLSESFSSPHSATTKKLEGNKYRVKIKALQANRKYFYRTFVKDGRDIFYGKINSFKTLDSDPPDNGGYEDEYVSRLHELLIDTNKLIFDATDQLTSEFNFVNEDLSNYGAKTDKDWCAVTIDPILSKMTVSVQENNTFEERKAIITLYDTKVENITRDLYVTQKGKQK